MTPPGADTHPAPASVIPSKRIGLLVLVLVLALGAIAVRTVWLQSVRNSMLTKFAQGQQQNTQVLPAVRGDILDRNGQELAVGEEALTVYATPHLIKDPALTAVRIGKLLKMKPSEQDALVGRLSDRNAGFAYVARQVPRAQAQPLVDAGIDGIGFYDEERRIYPLNTVGSQLLGFVNIDNQGIAGLEMLYDRSLSGRPGKQVVVRDPQGTALDVLSLEREIDGRDVQLTIDATIQTEVERVLTRTMKRFQAKSATAIVMDPRTGEIYSMASVPGVNANKFGEAPSEAQKNRAITDTYEPGSTFKIVTLSAALEEGLVTPTMEFDLPVKLKVADRTIEDSHDRPAVRMSVRDILVQSSNVGTVIIGQLLQKEGLDRWIRRFGFGAPTGIDFPGEVQGIMLHPDDWSGSTIGNVPIGQGIATTAIQLVAAYSAIANDGVMVQPHLLRKVSGETPPKYPTKRIISVETARIMQQMFGDVVTDDRGTGAQAKIPGYAVAGKTGTANIAEGGVYAEGRYVASFIGFVPARNPRLLTLVVVNEPNVPWGGDVAAPAFEQITEFALQYLAIPPDGVL
jgi:cell division protein FtsI (penicillin-binding protein 3)